jgi:hypothetical protein
MALSPGRGIEMGGMWWEARVSNGAGVIDERPPVPEFERATPPAPVSQHSAW